MHKLQQRAMACISEEWDSEAQEYHRKTQKDRVVGDKTLAAIKKPFKKMIDDANKKAAAEETKKAVEKKKEEEKKKKKDEKGKI